MLGRVSYINILIIFLNVFLGHLNFAVDKYAESTKGKLQFYKIDNNQLLKYKPSKPEYTFLGSLWKLFTYAYIQEENLIFSPYQCQGKSLDEAFCCSKNESVDIHEALIKSCGLYFSQNRLEISNQDWKQFWQGKNVNFAWLLELNKLKPNRLIKVEELFKAFEEIKRFRTFNTINQTLLRVVIDGTGKNAFNKSGSLVRFKTFTWNKSKESKQLVGGFAGWRKDGSLIWLYGNGKSSNVIQNNIDVLSDHWQKRNEYKLDGEACVEVKFFEDYPIKKIVHKYTRLPAQKRELNGDYEIIFKNGNHLDIHSSHSLSITSKKNRDWKVIGRMPISEYVARSLEREVKPNPKAAAEAFSILIRSYLYQKAKFQNGCFQAVDSSKFQRVSADDPSDKSLDIVYKTQGLIIESDQEIMYHSTKTSPNRLSWSKALEMASQGMSFSQILKNSYSNAKISLFKDHYSDGCNLIAHARNWINKQKKVWEPKLKKIIGYERALNISVCQLNRGRAFADKNKNRIYINGFRGVEDQITLAHEFLHLVFKNHPLGDDEQEIEKMARSLMSI